MKTTRDIDLGVLEVARDTAESPKEKKHIQSVLETVYEQSKDIFLENMRVQLEDAMKRGDFQAMERIRKQVMAYARNPANVRTMLTKINKSTDTEEGVLYLNRTLK